MDTKSAFLLQVLEKLAAPMVAAITEVSVRQAMMPDPTQPNAMRPEAEQVASLLTKSTQLSIGLTGLVDAKGQESEADSLRLALTSLSSPLMSNVYRLSGRSPTDSEIQRISEALSAVISYAENYTPAADATVRMEQIDADFFPADDSQVTIMYMNALIPVMNSIMAYSFGQPEKKLIQEVTDRLVRESKFLRAKMFPEIKEGTPASAKSDLAVLRMAGLIYSQCHFAEMAKLMATEDQVRQGMAPTMTALWQSFILRMQMLEILGDALIPGVRKTVADFLPKEDTSSGDSATTTSSSGSGGGVAPAAAKEPENKASSPLSPFAKPRVGGGDTAPSSSATESQPSAPQKPNPMSFFAKKNSA